MKIKGFTILELLVAMVITSIVLLGVLRLYQFTSTSFMHIKSDIDLEGERESLLLSLYMDFRYEVPTDSLSMKSGLYRQCGDYICRFSERDTTQFKFTFSKFGIHSESGVRLITMDQDSFVIESTFFCDDVINNNL